MKTCISIDLDNYREYQTLIGSGDGAGAISFYDDAIPRFLDLFDRHGIRATFFAIGRDGAVGAHRKLLREIDARGHEVASHSHTHPYNFRALSRPEKEAEIARAEETIGDIVGRRPVGFRAPSCDVDLETLRILEERGYLYDSSVVPSPIMWIFMLYGKLFVKHESYQLGEMRAALAPRLPYEPSPDALHRRRPKGGDRSTRILEIPCCSVLPGLRIPFYSTLVRRLGRGFFDGMRRLHGRRGPLLLLFHLVELAAFDETELGRDFERTPGLSVPLEQRERFIEHVTASVEPAESRTLRELAASLRADGQAA